jgi:hypothetical protein
MLTGASTLIVVKRFGARSRPRGERRQFAAGGPSK